jgi:hypothetical protein
MNVWFYLPDFYYKYDLNIYFINLLHDHPEYFIDGLKIGAVYGTFPGAIWNGGRVFLGTTDSINIEKTIADFNNLEVPVRFTFTNCVLQKEHVYDQYCNLIMKHADNGMNDVLINADVLEEYLRNKYPNFRYIMSTTKCERNLDKINEACEKYDLVVSDYRDNVNDEFLKGIKYKDKIEILLNAICDPNCPRRCEHYKFISEHQLNHTFGGQFCKDKTNGFLDAKQKWPTVVKTERLNELINMGYRHFKIEGRACHSADVIESYVYYMVKPEYRDEVRMMLIKAVW